MVAVKARAAITAGEAMKAGAAVKAGTAINAMSMALSTYSSNSDTVKCLPVPEPPNLQKHSTHPILSSLHPDHP